MDIGIGLAVAAAVVWGVYLVFLKSAFSGYPASLLTVLINSFALAWYLPIAGWRVGWTGAMTAVSGFGVAHVAMILIAAGGIAAAMVAFLRALAVGEVSYVVPINKIVPVFVLPIEVLLLGQLLTPLQVAGVVVATIAVYVANYRQGSLLEPLRRAAHSRPAQLALLSAACFAVSDVARRIALQELAIPTAVFVPLLLGGVLVLLVPSALRSSIRWSHKGREMQLTAWGKLAVAGGFVATGEQLTNLAFSVLPASIASPIVNTQAVVAVLLGGVLLRERQFRVRILAAVLAVVGVTMIAL